MRNQIIKAKAEHDKFLRKMGLTKENISATRRERSIARKKDFVETYPESLRVNENAPLSNMSEDVSSKSFTKKSVLDRPGPNATHREIKAWRDAVSKASHVAPAYNKGGYMYITPNADPKSLGRKV